MPARTDFDATAYPATFTVHRSESYGDRGPDDVTFVVVAECDECGDFAKFHAENPYEDDASDWAQDHAVNCPGAED